jgi:hypothetical protein
MGLSRVARTVGMVLLLAASSHAALSPEQAARANLLVGRFTARDFASRQSAVHELVRMGPDVIPLVRKTLEATADNEVKLRCEMVLKGIRETYIVGPGDTLINLDASRHTLAVKDQPVGQVLADLARASGNAPIMLKGTGIEKRPVTVSFKDLRYWEAVDRIAAAAKLGYSYDYNTRGICLYSASVAPAPQCFTGPAVVKVYTLTRSVTVINGANRRGVSLHFLCLYEERLPVLHAALVVTKITGGDGTALKVNAGQTQRGLWDGFNARPSVSLADVPEIVVRRVDLEGVVQLEYAVGRREVVLPKIEAGRELAPVDGFTMKVLDVAPARDVLRVVIEGKRRAGGPSFTTDDARYGLFVRDAAGKLHPGRRGTSQYVSGGYHQQVMFDHGSAAGPFALVLVIPERTEGRDYPYRIENVPLP